MACSCNLWVHRKETSSSIWGIRPRINTVGHTHLMRIKLEHRDNLPSLALLNHTPNHSKTVPKTTMQGSYRILSPTTKQMPCHANLITSILITGPTKFKRPIFKRVTNNTSKRFHQINIKGYTTLSSSSHRLMSCSSTTPTIRSTQWNTLILYRNPCSTTQDFSLIPINSSNINNRCRLKWPSKYNTILMSATKAAGVQMAAVKTVIMSRSNWFRDLNQLIRSSITTLPATLQSLLGPQISTTLLSRSSSWWIMIHSKNSKPQVPKAGVLIKSMTLPCPSRPLKWVL